MCCTHFGFPEQKKINFAGTFWGITRQARKSGGTFLQHFSTCGIQSKLIWHQMFQFIAENSDQASA
jgi:hypothetical protein